MKENGMLWHVRNVVFEFGNVNLLVCAVSLTGRLGEVRYLSSHLRGSTLIIQRLVRRSGEMKNLLTVKSTFSASVCLSNFDTSSSRSVASHLGFVNAPSLQYGGRHELF